MLRNLLFLLTASALSLSSCNKAKKNESGSSSDSKKIEASTEAKPVKIVEEKPTVCIWDKTSLLATPDSKGKWLSSISLGESVVFLGEKQNDKNSKRVYCKVRLSDGKEGWANEYCIVIDGSLAAIIKDSPLHKRPDPLTLTDKKFLTGEMLAIAETKGDWIKVVGKQRKKLGWLKVSSITSKTEEVTTAILMTKKIGSINGELDVEKAKSFIEEAPYKDAYFIKYLEEKLEASIKIQNEEALEEEVEHEGELEIEASI